MSKKIESMTPITDRVYNWVLTVLPKELHAGITAVKATIVREQDGFVRTGNRTAFGMDEEAFSSARIEPTDAGKVLNYSNMKGRREEDIARVVLMEFATSVFPPKPRKDVDSHGNPKVNTQVTAREKWVKALGFDKAKIGSGSRWTVTDQKKPGTDEMLRDIAALVPEVFNGTELVVPTTKQVAFVEPAELLSKTFYTTLPDPDHAKVSKEDVEAALQYVVLKYKQGATLKANEKTGAMPRIAQAYYQMYERQIAADEAREQQAVA